MAQTLEEEVNTPLHYRTHESGLEAIEITRYLIGDLSNAWKYAMRYEDKNTPKKDIKKLCWYLNDFHKHFIDENNNCTVSMDIPEEIKDMMLKVIETEPVEEMKECFRQIYYVVENNGIISPSDWFANIDTLTSFSDTLN